QVGALVYGPHLDLAPGIYRLELTISATSDGASPGQWDIAAHDGRTILDQGVIPASTLPQRLTIERIVRVPKDKDTSLEARVFALGEGDIQFRGMLFERCPIDPRPGTEPRTTQRVVEPPAVLEASSEIP